MPSNAALAISLEKYDALITSVEMSDYGYWKVTYSCAPGVSLQMLLCHTGITQQQARIEAATALLAQTGQKVAN
jgi:hypothetical protein